MLRVSECIYRTLLVLYPKQFRDAYGAQMAQVFRDAYREAVERSGVAGLVALWMRTLLDLLFTAFAERRNASTPPGSRLERLERSLERTCLLGSPWRAHTSRSWAMGATFFGILSVAVSVLMFLYGDWDFSKFSHLNNLALGLYLACQGAGNLLRARNGTFALLLRSGLSSCSAP